MKLQDLLEKALWSAKFKGTLEDLSEEELSMLGSFFIFEAQDRDMTKTKSVMGNSPINYWEDTFGSTPLATSSMEQAE